MKNLLSIAAATALLLVASTALAQPTKVGPGIQIKPEAGCASNTTGLLSGRAKLCIDSSDSNKLKLRYPSGSILTLDGSGGGGGSTGNYSFSSDAVDLSGAAEMSIAPTTATGVTIGKRLKAPVFVSTSSAPTFANGAADILGSPTSTSVSGTNQAGVVAFTTGTVNSASNGATSAALAEVFKLTFASFTAPTGCTATFYPAGADSDTAALNAAKVRNNFNVNSEVWSVCTTTTCSMYLAAATGASGFQSSSPYKFGYQISCW